MDFIVIDVKIAFFIDAEIPFLQGRSTPGPHLIGWSVHHQPASASATAGSAGAAESVKLPFQ